MKKSIFVGVAALTLALFSCGGEATGNGGTVEDDAKAVADITCEMFSLGTLNENDPEMVKLTEKHEKLVESIKDKYPEGSDAEKELQKLVEEELENCQPYKDLMEAFDSFGDAFEEGLENFEEGLEDFVEGLEEAFDE